MNEKNPISIRLKPETAEKFRTLAQINNMTQSKFIEMLIDNFSDGNYNKNQKIGLLLCKYNNFSKDEKKKRIGPRKYEFNGFLVYQPNFNGRPLYSASEYEEELRNEFEISKEINLDEYELQSSLYAYWNTDINKHIIFETLIIKKRFMQTYDICVNRCYEAEQCSDLEKRLHRYSNQDDRGRIEFILADPIKDTKEFELFY